MATTGFDESHAYLESNRDPNLLALTSLFNSIGGAKELPVINTELVQPRL